MVSKLCVARIGKKLGMWLNEYAWIKYEYNVVMRGYCCRCCRSVVRGEYST